MFRAIAILASLIGASAFMAPSARVARGSALKMNFEEAIGAQAPLGFWVSENYSHLSLGNDSLFGVFL